MRQAIVCLTVLALLALAGCQSTPRVVNLALNPGFESAASGPSVPDWQTNPKTSQVTLSAVAPRTGDHALSLAATTAGQPGFVLQTLPEGSVTDEVLHLRAWVRGGGAAPSAYGIWLRHEGEGRNGRSFVNRLADTAPPMAGWTRLDLYAYVGPRARAVTFGAVNTSSQPMEVDDVELSTVRAGHAAPPSWQARRILAEALDVMRSDALRASSVNWGRVEAAAYEMARDAGSAADAHPAISFALRALGDGHSHFLPPSSSPLDKSAGEGASLPEVESADFGHVAYVNIPAFGFVDADRSRRFADEIRRALVQQSSHSRCGWVVDLRENSGGNMYPMLVGLWPLLGDGKLGAFVSPSRSDDWGMHEATMMAGEIELSSGIRQADMPWVSAPVVVLVGPRTMSSGEIAALSFVGRPHTEFLGAASGGFLTANRLYRLSDGSALALTVADVVDREGRRHDAITPDVASAGTRSRPNADDEGVRDAVARLAARCEAVR